MTNKRIQYFEFHCFRMNLSDIERLLMERLGWITPSPTQTQAIRIDSPGNGGNEAAQENLGLPQTLIPFSEPCPSFHLTSFCIGFSAAWALACVVLLGWYNKRKCSVHDCMQISEKDSKTQLNSPFAPLLSASISPTSCLRRAVGMAPTQRRQRRRRRRRRPR